MPDQPEPSLIDTYLATFRKNNPHIEISVEDGYLLLDKAWGADDVRISINIEDIDTIRDLNNLQFWPKFDAIIHLDTTEIEIFYGYIPKNHELTNPILDRKFNFNFDNQRFDCNFKEPTNRLLKIASHYKRLLSISPERTAHQLLEIRDGQKVSTLSLKNQDFFKDKIVRNFFVKLEKLISESSFEKIAPHMNFAMSYYDRKSPLIIIREDTTTTKEKYTPSRFIENAFPSNISLNLLDDFMLQLNTVARETPPRFAFVYYYQIIEYAGYYFLDGKAKRELRLLLRDPSLVSCDEDKISQLFSFISELNHNDDVKMKKVIEEYCDPKMIWREVEADRGFFSSNISFEGGVEIGALISKDTTEESWNTMWMPKLYDQLTKIRNYLVHARERRQGLVILPTENNSRKIRHYVALIRRVAEQITINRE